MWGGHSWVPPPFQAAPRATAKTDSCCKPKTCLPIHRAASKGGCSHEWLPHSGSSSFLDLRRSESRRGTHECCHCVPHNNGDEKMIGPARPDRRKRLSHLA